eukprot:scaffold3917_cov377-Prasinococcus_capsulatus_cf.AAC.12
MVETQAGQHLRVNFNVSFWEMSCAVVEVGRQGLPPFGPPHPGKLILRLAFVERRPLTLSSRTTSGCHLGGRPRRER